MKIYAVISTSVVYRNSYCVPQIHYFSLDKEKSEEYINECEKTCPPGVKGMKRIEELESETSLSYLCGSVMW